MNIKWCVLYTSQWLFARHSEDLVSIFSLLVLHKQQMVSIYKYSQEDKRDRMVVSPSFRMLCARMNLGKIDGKNGCLSIHNKI